MKKTFRVSRNYPKVLRNRKRRIERRLAPQHWEAQEQPMMGGSNIHYELSSKVRGSGYGGLGAVHLLVQRLGLIEEIDKHLQLLKVHLPYQESDHVLNIAYNVFVGGQRLEDIELRRQDESFLDGLGASLVGPRPCMGYEFEHYNQWQRRRFDTLPGLTGLWQVSGKNKTTFSEMIAMDLYYTESKSLWLDLKILMMTIPTLLSQLKATRLPHRPRREAPGRGLDRLPSRESRAATFQQLFGN